MDKKKKSKDKFDFYLQNKHYKRLHLFLYLMSVLFLFFIYIVIITLFSDITVKYVLIGFISMLIGVYLVYNRDNMVKYFSEKIEEKRRKSIRKNDKEGLKTTLKRITPKNKNLKLKITGKTSFKDKISNFKEKIKKEKKEKKDYIEIE